MRGRGGGRVVLRVVLGVVAQVVGGLGPHLDTSYQRLCLLHLLLLLQSILNITLYVVCVEAIQGQGIPK